MLTACAAGTSPTGAAPTESEDGSPAAQGEPVAAHEEPCTPLADLPGGDVENAPVDESATFPWQRDDPVAVPGFNPVEIISGGPPPDGIAPIDSPCFTDVETADAWLTDEASVMVVDWEGETRAYPVAIMTRHEIVNDVIGGDPVVVTYCPLCNSGLAFRRTVDGQVLDFGTSGRLFQSNLVMYDRQAKSLWAQFTGEAVVGEPWVGTELERIPTSLLGWAEFRESAPDGLVLSRNTGFSREYGSNPYPGYEGAGDGFLFRGPRDERLDPNSRVVGLGDENDAAAVPLERLESERVVSVEVNGREVVVFWAPGQASALQAREVDGGDDVGQTGAFEPVASDGTALTFTPAPDDETVFVDEQTGSRWNLLGEAVEGPLAGETLTPVSHDDTFWFVWFAFREHTTIASA